MINSAYVVQLSIPVKKIKGFLWHPTITNKICIFANNASFYFFSADDKTSKPTHNFSHNSNSDALKLVNCSWNTSGTSLALCLTNEIRIFTWKKWLRPKLSNEIDSSWKFRSEVDSEYR